MEEKKSNRYKLPFLNKDNKKIIKSNIIITHNLILLEKIVNFLNFFFIYDICKIIKISKFIFLFLKKIKD